MSDTLKVGNCIEFKYGGSDHYVEITNIQGSTIVGKMTNVQTELPIYIYWNGTNWCIPGDLIIHPLFFRSALEMGFSNLKI